MTRQGPPRSGTCDPTPTPDDLECAPELAILAALDHTLELAATALVCAHPELPDPERPYWLGSPTRSLTLAKILVRRTHGLQRTIRAYRRALEIQRQHEHSTDLADLDF